MPYEVIHTSYGLARLAAAEVSGNPINITHVAIGDGAGQPAPPAESLTQLVRERYRTTVNEVGQDPDNPKRYFVEAIIPVEVGGFTMREVGIYDDQGGLFVVGDLPDAVKPTKAEGAFGDTVLRIEFEVSNANIINLLLDPNVAVATRQWVTNTVTVKAMIPGGTTGQVLRKRSNIDGDTVWADPDTANVVVDMIEERQVLAAGQTAVTWSIVTTRALAIYIDGLRLTKGPGADEWREDLDNYDTTVLLGKSYPAGTEIVGVQNDPTGSASFPLVRDLNLADVPDKPLARRNLGVFSREESRQLAPPGLIGAFARISPPTGWLRANGAEVSRTAYPELFAAIGTLFGAGNGYDTFNLPEIRGEHIRFLDDGRGIDPGRGLGTLQLDQNKAHIHEGETEFDDGHSHGYSYQAEQYSGAPGAATGNGFTNRTFSSTTGKSGRHKHLIKLESSGGAEVRVRTVAFLGCIKY